ncbi:MAG: ssDNA-binding protein [Gordonibacter pamelaeae]
MPKSDKATVAKLKAAYEAAVEKGKATKWKGEVRRASPSPCATATTIPPTRARSSRALDPARLLARRARRGGAHDPHVAIEDSTRVYSGCYARVSLNMSPTTRRATEGVCRGPENNVQFLRDGESLGGRSRAASDSTPWTTTRARTSMSCLGLLGACPSTSRRAARPTCPPSACTHHGGANSGCCCRATAGQRASRAQVADLAREELHWGWRQRCRPARRQARLERKLGVADPPPGHARGRLPGPVQWRCAIVQARPAGASRAG